MKHHFSKTFTASIRASALGFAYSAAETWVHNVPSSAKPTLAKRPFNLRLAGLVLATAAVLSAAPSAAITIIGRVAEGTSVISGITDKSATVEVKDLGSGSLLALQGGGVTASADKTTGLVTLTLAEPLYDGQRIQFLVGTNGSLAAATIDAGGTQTELDVRALGDWGRVRANFAAGVVLSFDNNFQLYSTPSSTASNSASSSNSSQATLFMDFTAERNWLWAGVKKSMAAKGPDDASPEFKLIRHVAFTTFFEARLTSVPVSVCPAGTATTSPTNSAAFTLRPAAASSTGTSGANSSGCGSGTSGTDTLSTFLNSAKSAELQGGAYLPIITTVWSYNNAPNALFFAPVARLGFITPTGSTTSGSTSVQPVNGSNFYNFYGFGGRIGHFKMSSDHNAAPQLLSYFDVMLGRYSNLDTLQATANGTAAIRRWRVAIEGTLKVPSTPFLLGVSANIGQNLTGPPTLQAAKDDLRFFIGAEFDVGKLMAKLPSL
jgi:hypothetical protein